VELHSCPVVIVAFLEILPSVDAVPSVVVVAPVAFTASVEEGAFDAVVLAVGETSVPVACLSIT
jgi:hypothetical protein